MKDGKGSFSARQSDHQTRRGDALGRTEVGLINIATGHCDRPERDFTDLEGRNTDSGGFGQGLSG